MADVRWISVKWMKWEFRIHSCNINHWGICSPKARKMGLTSINLPLCLCLSFVYAGTQDFHWDLLVSGLSEEAKENIKIWLGGKEWWQGDDRRMLTNWPCFSHLIFSPLVCLFSTPSLCLPPVLCTFSPMVRPISEKWSIKFRKIVLDCLPHWNFLVLLTYYVHWENLNLAFPFYNMKEK